MINEIDREPQLDIEYEEYYKEYLGMFPPGQYDRREPFGRGLFLRVPERYWENVEEFFIFRDPTDSEKDLWPKSFESVEESLKIARKWIILHPATFVHLNQLQKSQREVGIVDPTGLDLGQGKFLFEIEPSWFDGQYNPEFLVMEVKGDYQIYKDDNLWNKLEADFREKFPDSAYLIDLSFDRRKPRSRLKRILDKVRKS